MIGELQTVQMGHIKRKMQDSHKAQLTDPILFLLYLNLDFQHCPLKSFEDTFAFFWEKLKKKLFIFANTNLAITETPSQFYPA